MNESMKVALQVGALGVGGLILYGLVSGYGADGGAGGEGVGTSTSTPTPSYLSYNQPNLDDIPATDQSGAMPSSAGFAGPTCSCGGSSLTTFSGSQAFEDSLNNSLGDLVDTYQANVLGQFPSYVTQFFNDTQGAELSTQSQTTFASMAGEQ